MSNILRRDRTPLSDSLDVLSKIAKLAEETTKIVHDANKIPNRKQDNIGNRIMDHILTAYESGRAANMILVKDAKDQSRREGLAYRCVCELRALCADINILNILVPGNIGGNEWYRNWSYHTTSIIYLAVKWQEYEANKLKELQAAESKEIARQKRIEKEEFERRKAIKKHRLEIELEIKKIEPKIIIKKREGFIPSVVNQQETLKKNFNKSKNHRNNFANNGRSIMHSY